MLPVEPLGLLSLFTVFEGEQAPTDQGLAEFVPEITGPVGCFDEDLIGRLVQPGPLGHGLFPVPVTTQPGIGGHVHCCSGHGYGSFPPGDPVPDLSAGARGRPVEGFHSGGEIVRFCFQGEHGLDVTDAEEIGAVLGDWRELLDDRPLYK